MYLQPLTKNNYKMKKTTTIALLLSFAVFITACNNQVKYNDTVVNLYENYTTQITDQFQKIADEKIKKEDALVIVAALEKKTDSCIGVMNDLKPSDEAKDFHNKVTGVFSGVKTDYLPLAKQLAELKGTSDVDAYNKLVEDMNKAEVKITTLESEAIAAQQVYASKVGMQIKK